VLDGGMLKNLQSFAGKIDVNISEHVKLLQVNAGLQKCMLSKDTSTVEP